MPQKIKCAPFDAFKSDAHLILIAGASANANLRLWFRENVCVYFYSSHNLKVFHITAPKINSKESKEKRETTVRKTIRKRKKKVNA